MKVHRILRAMGVSTVLGAMMMLAAGCFMHPTQETTWNGTLHSVKSADGSQITGWTLAQGMGGMSSMNLDVSDVESEAMKLEGKQVQVTGDMSGGSMTMKVKKIGVVSK